MITAKYHAITQPASPAGRGSPAYIGITGATGRRSFTTDSPQLLFRSEQPAIRTLLAPEKWRCITAPTNNLLTANGF